MRNRYFIVFVILTVTIIRLADAETAQPRRLVDAHTAGILDRGKYDFEFLAYAGGEPRFGSGLIFGIEVGVTNRLTIGLSYGGEGIVGRGKAVRWNSLPGWLVKYRLIEEKIHFPAIAIGYDHQGHGGIADTSLFFYKGYIFKSPGFFITAGKGYLILNIIQIGIHCMGNYSMEEFKEVTWPNLITGLDIGINDELSLVLEYDFAFNMLDPRPYRNKLIYANPSEGYLNAGIRWALSGDFFLEFDVRDILENRKYKNGQTVGWNREFKAVFFSQF